jgi:carbon-monoxide dehydrogenase medium subunit
VYPAAFDYLVPNSLDEALRFLTQHGDDAKLLAGGHSLIPMMKLRLAQPRYLIDLDRLPDLRGIRQEGDAVVIGALTLHADVAASALLRARLTGLAEAAGVIGDMQVRNRGTIGGSVAHADPGADLPVVLTALNSSFVLASQGGTRTVAADEFFVDVFTTVLRADEVLTEIRVPTPPNGSASAYEKLPNPASGYVVVSAGALIGRDASGRCTVARVMLGGLAGKPLRAAACEAALLGRQLTPETVAAAAARAADGGEPQDDLYASADYKRHMAEILARRAIESATQRAESR